MIRSLASDGEFEHPLLGRPGYWQEPGRVLFAPSEEMAAEGQQPRLITHPLLVLGGGQLGRAFSHWCDVRGIDHVLASRDDVDLSSADGCDELLRDLSPWAVIDAAGRVPGQQPGAEQRWLANAQGARNLADACARHGIRFVTFSTGSVFDGTASSPYRESHPVSPQTAFGACAVGMEKEIGEANPEALVIRPGSYFSPWGSDGFVNLTARALRSGLTVRASPHVTVSPTYVPDFVSACLDLVADRVDGLLHLTNKGAVSWADWVLSVAQVVGADRSQVVVDTDQDAVSPARTPRYRVLESERADLLAPFEDAFERFSNDYDLRR
jgi:dTDP-4-dehydrorhamnose reductase